MPRIVLLKQAAKETGLSEWELSTGSKAGRYPAFRIGGERGRWAFDLDLLEARIKELMLENLEHIEPEQSGYGKLRKIQ